MNGFVVNSIKRRLDRIAFTRTNFCELVCGFQLKSLDETNVNTPLPPIQVFVSVICANQHSGVCVCNLCHQYSSHWQLRAPTDGCTLLRSMLTFWSRFYPQRSTSPWRPTAELMNATTCWCGWWCVVLQFPYRARFGVTAQT